MPLYQDAMQCHARMLLKIALANIKVSLMCELHPNIQWARMRAAIFSKRAILAAICTTEIFLFFHSFQQFFHRRSLCSTSVHPLCLENLHQLSAVHPPMQVTVDLEVGGQDFFDNMAPSFLLPAWSTFQYNRCYRIMLPISFLRILQILALSSHFRLSVRPQASHLTFSPL